MLQQVKQSTTFQNNADIFDGDVKSSNFDVTSIRYVTIICDVITPSIEMMSSPNLKKNFSYYWMYLLIKFEDNQSGRTC